MRRNEDAYSLSSIHIFSTHFFSHLTTSGLPQVESWTRSRNIDIFQKKIVIIPINEQSHWSLVVIVNPGEIQNSIPKVKPNKSGAMPCMFHLDSLQIHNTKAHCKKLYQWLEREWYFFHKKTPYHFNEDTMPFFVPRNSK